MKALFSLSLILTVLFGAPLSAYAASGVEVSGWIPYWTVKAGTRAASSHLASFDELNPFVYTVKSDGSIADQGNITSSEWKKLFKAAKKKGVRIMPSIMWSDRANIEKVLSNPTSRAAHVKIVADMVKKGGYDGVDIDYENKSAATRVHYSAFLKELDAALGSALLSCTIEARTPPDSLYRNVPATIEYANDFKEINKYCDEVKIMTYDQQTADWKLNSAAPGIYAPVSDAAWAKKVLELAMKDIDKDKLEVGIPTYGHEYEITVNPSGPLGYKKLWSLNPSYATDTARKEKVKAYRSRSGEMTVTYIPKTSTAYKSKLAVAPKGTPESEKVLAAAKAYAAATGKPTTINYISWSDDSAIKQKVDLARSLGVRGVAIFKIDGGTDLGLWKVIK